MNRSNKLPVKVDKGMKRHYNYSFRKTSYLNLL